MYQSVLFICSGNICRSPTAEGMLRQKLKEHNLTHIRVDSAGMHAFHEGCEPDGRAKQAAKSRGYNLDGLLSRPIRLRDFEEFELIIAMDSGHLAGLERAKPKDSKAVLKMHSDFATAPSMRDVPDPYYGGEEHFNSAFDLIENGVNGILEILKK